MSKVTLPDITSGYNLSAINSNFQKIEDALNKEVLYRKGYLGEPNEMQTNLDMNGKQILNVTTGTSDGSLVSKGYVDQGLALKFDKSGGPLSGSVDMQNNQINNLPNATQPSQPATYAQLLQVEAPGDSLLRNELAATGGLGLIGDIPKPITWSGFAGGAQGDSASNSLAISAANATGLPYMVPDGYWPNTVDATFNIYPSYRNYSGGHKLKRGLPGAGAQNPYPLIWAEKTSNMQRVDGGTKWFDVAMQGALTLEPTATAFGVGVSGYIRSSAGDVLTVGKSVDAIGVHGSGKAIGQNGRVWGLWGQAGNGDDGSGVRSSQLVACELNLVNLFASQPHPENLPTGEGPYRGLIVTTADGGKGCGIAIDVGDGSGRPVGESGWWIGLRLRKDGVRPAGDWRNNYLEDTQQLKIEGSVSNIHRYGGIRLGPRFDGSGINFTYGFNALGSVFQDANAINLDEAHRIYWGPVSGATKWIGYESATGSFNFRNMTLSINSTKVVGLRKTGFDRMTGTPLKTTFNADAATLQQVAQRLKAIEDALHADTGHGLYGLT